MAEPSTESCSFIFHLSSLAETQPLRSQFIVVTVSLQGSRALGSLSVWETESQLVFIAGTVHQVLHT